MECLTSNYSELFYDNVADDKKTDKGKIFLEF